MTTMDCVTSTAATGLKAARRWLKALMVDSKSSPGHIRVTAVNPRQSCRRWRKRPDLMKILVATDAWHPQVNGVVRTLGHVAREAPAFDAEVAFISPDQFWTLPMPSYPEIRLALLGPGDIERCLERVRPDAIHIATEGPIGHAMRRVCLRRGLPFTTSFHTRFPDYLAERLPVPERWTNEITWAWLRRFHASGVAVLAATPTLA